MISQSVLKASWRVGAAAIVAGTLAGCAAGTSSNGPGSQQQGCNTYMTTGPTTGTADHAVVAPGNQVQFQAYSGETCTNGASPAVVALVYASWSNPDPLDVTVSSAADFTNGLATCKNTTAGPVTLTATATLSSKVYSSSVQLTCK